MGSTTDGTIFSGDLREPQLAPLPRYPDDPRDKERRTAIGMKADKRGNLVVAGGDTGKVFVLSTADGSTRKVLDTGLRTRDNTFLNDVAIFKGYAYITDSVAPVLYRVRLGSTASASARTARPASSRRSGPSAVPPSPTRRASTPTAS